MGWAQHCRVLGELEPTVRLHVAYGDISVVRLGDAVAERLERLYPFLPFTHGINAMHAAMAGAYHMEYWVELGILASYLVPSLALGVVFRRPVIKANDWIIEKLESTKLI